MLSISNLIKKDKAEKVAAREILGLPVGVAPYVVLDTELTGLTKKDSIVSIGAVKMSGTRIIPAETFYAVVKPETTFSPESVAVHFITPSDVEDLSSISEELEAFLEFLDGSVVVGHFLGLDLKFINRALKRFGGLRLDSPCVDTSRVHDWIRGNDGVFGRHYGGFAEGNDLYSMASKYGVPMTDAHNSLMDAFTTAQVFQRFLSVLPSLGVRTVNDLVRVGKP